MPSNATTILRWTGKGRLDDLLSSIAYVLDGNGVRGRVARVGDSVVVEGPEPLGVVALLGQMPGVSWVAAGFAGRSAREISSAAEAIARRYLGSRDRFWVEAEGREGSVASDVRGSITSAILGAVRGSRVSERSPKARFRAAFEGGRGVVGVEVKQGPGGTPTGRESAVCLVSGGMHSSVTAWYAVLQGFRLRLVHVRTGEEGLRAVARLYSELSHRSDPRWLGLDVLEGGPLQGALSVYVGRLNEPVFGGFTPSAKGDMGRLPGVAAPLYLMPEEKFRAEYGALGIKGFDAPMEWKSGKPGELRLKRFGGRAADVSEVLGGLK